MGRTLSMDKNSLNNVDYVRILIGNLDVSLVPPVVPNFNIGAGYYDIEFTREIPRGKLAKEMGQQPVEYTDQNLPNSGNGGAHTPKRSRNDAVGNSTVRNNASNGGPTGFMGDARRTYVASTGGNMFSGKADLEVVDTRRKKKGSCL